jgi:hypothetical protein
MAGSIFIPLISVFDGKGIRDAKTGLAAITGLVKNMKGAAIAAAASMATIGAIGFVKDAVTSARDLESSYVGLTGLYGDLAPQMKQFTIDAKAIGLSQLEASRSVTFLGSALGATGLPMDEVSTKTKNLVALASDLAATFGLPLQEALTGIGATFRGEYDPIERFGVAIKQAQVNALLATRGQKGLTGQLLAAAQAQARYDLLLQATAKTQGNYAKQVDSLYVKQQNLAASFENVKAQLGASLTAPLAALLGSLQPVVDLVGQSLTPAFEMLGKFIIKLAPLFAPLGEVLTVLYDAFTPIMDVLLAIIEPLLVPLIEIFKVLVMIIKPLIPIITLLARVIGAILVPVVVVLSVALTLVIKILQKIFEAFAAIPGVGEAFKGMNEGLKGVMDGFGGVMDKISGVNNSTDEMTGKLSKKLPVPNVNGTTKALGKVSEAAKQASEKMTDLLKNALSIQKSIIDSTNITGVLDQTSNDIVESVVYLDGKFKTVISGIKNNSTDLVGAFQGSLTKIKTFYTNLNELLKANLDPALIEQITSAGPDAGNATAEAILASGKTGIKSLNKTFKDIKKVSGDIGAKVAKSMQQTGADIGNGLIDGIKAQTDRLNTLATSMGNNFGSAFANAIPTGMGNTGDPAAPSSSSTSTGMTPYAFPKGIKPSDYGIYLKAMEIKNPYDKASSPAQYKRFSEALSTANQYNIAINVAPGATNADIGRHLVSAIQTYERKNGKQF